MTVYQFVLLIWLHFVGDFIFQTNKINMYKETNFKVLLLHATLYALPFAWFGYVFAGLVWVQHIIVDYAIPRATSRLWVSEQKPQFFSLFAFDQLLHITLLVLTYDYLRMTYPEYMINL